MFLYVVVRHYGSHYSVLKNNGKKNVHGECCG